MKKAKKAKKKELLCKQMRKERTEAGKRKNKISLYITKLHDVRSI